MSGLIVAVVSHLDVGQLLFVVDGGWDVAERALVAGVLRPSPEVPHCVRRL